MGGRLDATNVVPDNMIAVSVLTAVDLDHQFFLGDTVIKIAQEKAGIARKGRPFVLGTQRHEGVKEAIEDVLEKIGSHLANAVEVKVREWDERIDGPKRSPFSLVAPHATFQPPPPQPVVANLPCLPIPINAILPLYGAHQLDNLGTALAIVNELINFSESLEIITPLHLKQRLTAGTIEKGIKNVKWPGRLSFHTINVSIPSFSSKSLAELHSAPIPFSMDKKYPLIVLVDGAHNSASAKTLGGYIASLLDLTLESASSPSPLTTININITYILALSHSPPKTPLQTLSPIFLPKVSSQSPCTILNVKTSVALLRFRPPEGMPWVKPVPPKEMEEVVRSLVPDAELRAFEDSMSPSSSNCELKDALRWAAQQGSVDPLSPEGHGISSSLIVLAGSLYLVADFYRLLESTETI